MTHRWLSPVQRHRVSQQGSGVASDATVGTLTVLDSGEASLPVPPARQKILLAAMLMRAGRVTPQEGPGC